VFGAHVWRRDPSCAWLSNKESLLNSLSTIESSTLVFHGIISKHLLFLSFLILKIMHVETTVMGSIGIPELDFKYGFNLSLHLSQSR